MWVDLRTQTSEYSKKLSDARKALSSERSLADVSAFDSRTPVDTSKFDGELLTKDVNITAKVKKGDAPVEDRKLRLRLTKVELKNGPEGKSFDGRWVITGIEDAGAPAATS